MVGLCGVVLLRGRGVDKSRGVIVDVRDIDCDPG